jgi:beta-glucosidase
MSNRADSRPTAASSASSEVEQQLARLGQRARAIRLPAGMTLGTATAAYQIEGAVTEDGRGESIWDSFCRKPGAIERGESGDIACDHYHRWREDIALMREMQVTTYRMSIAWSRVLPEGRGAVNEKGLAFYDRLIDALLENGIEPFVTLYHWDLPQALLLQGGREGGGWYRRGVVDDYAAYADLVTRRYGDRIKNWMTINEPWTFCWSGHASGEDAPGYRDGVKGGLLASHHALLAHGLGVGVIRANVADGKVGPVFDLNCAEPASDDAADKAAALRFDGAQNRWFLDAVCKGSYPADMLDLYARHNVLPDIRDGDLKTIAAPVDFIGINIYRRSVIKAGADLPPLNFQRVSPAGRYTSVNYEIWPQSMYDILHYVRRNYGPQAIYICENGASFDDDVVQPDGRVIDLERADYMVSYLEQAARAAAEGVPLKGYFAWTLIDNFEWACGYRTRFGLAHVDFQTQARRIKESGRLYGEIAARVKARMPD